MPMPLLSFCPRPLVAAGLLLAACGAAHAGILTNKADKTLLGAYEQGQFASSANAQADLNKDGFKDLIVGSTAVNGQSGLVQVFYGSARGPATTAGFSYAGPMEWAQVGTDPVVADVNADGWPDLIVGANNYSGALPYSGAVLVFLGSASGLPSEPSQIIEGPSTNSFFGFRVRLLGDFNGDGHADIAVAAQGANSSAGQISVYAGSPTGLNPTPVSTIGAAPPWKNFGQAFVVADVQGDGIPDIVVGMPRPVGGIPGMVWVFKGTNSGYANTKTDFFAPAGVLDTDGFGSTVSALGDVDGDGHADLAVGAPMHIGASGKGLIVVYYGSESGWSGSGRTQLLQGDDVLALAFLGNNMLGNRDMNGDGHPDLLVGPSMLARPNDETLPWPGSVWVYLGSPTGLASVPKQVVSGAPDSRDEVGTTLEAAQVMGGKAMDLIAGSALYTQTLLRQGVVRVYRGVTPRRP